MQVIDSVISKVLMLTLKWMCDYNTVLLPECLSSLTLRMRKGLTGNASQLRTEQSMEKTQVVQSVIR